MNSLSILIYLAEFIPSLGHMFGIMLVLCPCAVLAATMMWSFNSSEYSFDSQSEKQNKRELVSLAKTSMRYSIIVFAVSAVMTVIIPSRNTIMMIAASEYGEALYRSDAIQDILNPASKLLKSFIKEELEKREKK